MSYKLETMCKAWLSLLLVAALALLPATAFAEPDTPADVETPTAETEVTTKTIINPLYANSVDVSAKEATGEFSLAEDSDAPYFGLAQIQNGEAHEYLRDQMINRECDITLRLEVEDLALAAEKIEELFELALLHDGNGSAGDYLRFSFDSWSYDSFLENGEGPYVIGVTYHINFFTKAEEEREVDRKVEEIGAELKLDELDDYGRVYQIYRYITSHVAYDFDNLNDDEYTKKYTAYAALFDGKAVFQGYAALFYRLCNAYNVSSRIIPGIAVESGEPHAWNIVCVNGLYYNVDCTWDAGRVAGTYEYFLKCDAGFADHQREAEYADENFYAYQPMSEVDYTIPPDFEGDETHASGYFSYKLDGAGNALVTAYSGNEETIVVPSELDGHPVYAIDANVFGETCQAQTITLSEGIRGWFDDGDSAFMFCPNLTTVNLPSTVGYHDGSPYDIIAHNNRFHDCEKLKTINLASDNPYLAVVDNVLFTKDMETLIYYPTGATASSYSVPDGVITIDDCAFSHQQYLTSVTLPESLETIGWFAFDAAHELQSANIPENCTYIGEWAFCNTAIEAIHIPASVEDIIAPAFGTPELTAITVAEGNPYYYAEDGILYSRKQYGDLEVVTLECVPAKSGTTVLTIPEGITDIGMNACLYCYGLKEVTIPSSVRCIHIGAFADCQNLQRVTYAGGAEGWNAIEVDADNQTLMNAYAGVANRSIEDATISLSKSTFTYNARVQKPTVSVAGEQQLEEGVDYTLAWSNASSMNAGTYTVTVNGKGNYDGAITATYTIKKAANPLSIKNKTTTVKYSKLKRKSQGIAVTKAIAFTKKGVGKLSYKLASVSKGKFKKYFKVNATSGKITVKKGLKKGTYKLKVAVKAGGNDNYLASKAKTITCKIVVK